MSCTAALGLRYALNCTIFDATVTAVVSLDSTIARYALISDSTHPCHGSAPAFAGLPHPNEHLCDHVFIIICLVISKTGMKSQMRLSLLRPETAMRKSPQCR